MQAPTVLYVLRKYQAKCAGTCQNSRIEGATSAALLTPLMMHVIELLSKERLRNVALRVLAVHGWRLSLPSINISIRTRTYVES